MINCHHCELPLLEEEHIVADNGYGVNVNTCCTCQLILEMS